MQAQPNTQQQLLGKVNETNMETTIKELQQQVRDPKSERSRLTQITLDPRRNYCSYSCIQNTSHKTVGSEWTMEASTEAGVPALEEVDPQGTLTARTRRNHSNNVNHLSNGNLSSNCRCNSMGPPRIFPFKRIFHQYKLEISRIPLKISKS